MDIIQSLLLLRVDCNILPNALAGADPLLDALGAPAIIAVPLRAVHSNDIASYEGAAFSAAALVHQDPAHPGVALPSGVALVRAAMSPEMLAEMCLEGAKASGMPCIAACATAFGASPIYLSSDGSLSLIASQALALLESAPPLLGLSPIEIDGLAAFVERPARGFSPEHLLPALSMLDAQAKAQAGHASAPKIAQRL